MSNEEIKSIKNRQRGLKTQLTNFDKFLSSINTDNEISNEVIVNLKQRLNIIQLILDTFYDLQIRLEELEKSDEAHLLNRETFENQFFSVISRAQTILNSEDDILSEQTPDQRVATSVNLPKINLPTFDGTLTSWVEFFDAFTAMVHSNNQLNNCQKLSYLRSSLKGEAQSTLKSLQTTNENYLIAWNALKTRYNNKRKIIEMHIKNLLNIEPVLKENPSNLRQFIDIVENTMNCLTSLKQPTDKWDALVVPILVNKLNFLLIKEWENKINSENNNSDKIISYQQLMDFLKTKHSVLESISIRTDSFRTNNSKPDLQHKFKQNTKPFYNQTRTLISTSMSCIFCQGNHFQQNCREFLKLSINDRKDKVKHLKLCFNCLRQNHSVQDCQSFSMCKVCNNKHHTTLHSDNRHQNMNNNQSTNLLINSEGSSSSENHQNIGVATSLSATNSLSPRNAFYVLLSTAQVFVYDKTKQVHTIRILLDSASQSNYLTKSVCEKLKLKIEPTNMSVAGINPGTQKIFEKTSIKINSRFNNFNTEVPCLVLNKITDSMPTVNFNKNKIEIPYNISLADELFYETNTIDMLLGAEFFWSILSIGQTTNSDGTIFQKTKLGWIVSGRVNLLNCSNRKNVTETYSSITLDNLHEELKQFWKIDEFNNSSKFLTIEEEFCENHFNENTRRTKDGRFMVKLPLKQTLTDLGDSFQEAKQRFLSLERKFKVNSTLKAQYKNDLNNYRLKNYCSISQLTLDSFYLPHHPVVKNDRETTKLRIVFDGSCKLSSGLNLNQIQYVGATIQEDLFSIITRFRTYKYVMTADIEQMYHQVLIHPDHRKYQKFLWREETDQEIKCYELNTVTFGLSSAPFLAIRCLIELANLNINKFPIESEIIKNDFYVDDLITGSNSIEELKNIKTNMINILNQAKFKLTKWKSNYLELNEVPKNQVFNKSNESKVLGMAWNSATDNFFFSITNNHKELTQKVTKRNILSLTAQLFDPMGLLAPIVIIPKLIIQQLWKLNLHWDESVPSDIFRTWISFRNELMNINHIEIPRFALLPKAKYLELHGFSDASEKAYGACVYLKSIGQNGEIMVNLIGSKSRVAPLKQISLPRLELCAAVLLTSLIDKLRKTLKLNFNRECYWSDSEITLFWIKNHPSKWTTFVANRVSHIQAITKEDDWFHVKSLENPADLISRGVLPSNLIKQNLWWKGPAWLSENTSYKNYILNKLSLDKVPECKSKETISFVCNDTQQSFAENYSNLNKLIHITALCLRFKNNCLNRSQKRTGIITMDEREKSVVNLVLLVQNKTFFKEIKCLKDNKEISEKSKILSLAPFLDSNGIIRVGGRLKNSNLTYDNKHPILLPHNDHLTRLIMHDIHLKNMHAGPSQMVYLVRQRFWPIGARNMAKLIVRKCIKCIRYKPIILNPLMGNLPEKRVKSDWPFQTTGVDYAGPFQLKDRQTRSPKIIKGYICVFICFATKAIHLELITSLSTDSFLAMFRRFVSRRGKPLNIYSDMATNFQGANNELKKLCDFLTSNANKIEQTIHDQSINWHFIPPHSPHFGGLWEAGVKSVKFHLKRVISNALLTFEEFYTVILQIESILNSRPLNPMSDDPNDLHVLTPAHFLIGRSFASLPDPDVSEIPINRLGRYEYLQKLNQDFWKRWSNEYLSTLQRRSKWKQNNQQYEMKKDDLVLLKEDNLAPCLWKIGRIVDLFPGKDGINRVVSVKCANGSIFKRSITKVCYLPND